jgi:hypothetical protein
MFSFNLSININKTRFNDLNNYGFNSNLSTNNKPNPDDDWDNDDTGYGGSNNGYDF